jgi:hypothetical protein
MSKIPTQSENPTGLHQRYIIKKLVKNQDYDPELSSGFGECNDEYFVNNVDRGSEYFVMRLDEGGKDREHIKACRIGVHAYADAIEHHLPELAKDLKSRYPLL